jgi:hypothetical protein
MSNLTLSQKLEFVRSALNCSQSHLCRSLCIKKLDYDSEDYKIIIENLYAVSLPYISKGFNGEKLFKILESHVYRDHAGNKDSVFSALIQNKYSLTTLEVIATTANDLYFRTQKP